MFDELEAFLNSRDANRPLRREHHLPRECYSRTDAVFCLTLCARHHGEPFVGSQLAAGTVEALLHRRRTQVWRVYAYCLMPDHLHAVVQLRAPEGERPRKDLLDVVAEFKSYTTRLAWNGGLHGRLWQHDQYDTWLRNESAFRTRCTYVLNNPVRKGLVADWTEWRWSGMPDEW